MTRTWWAHNPSGPNARCCVCGNAAYVEDNNQWYCGQCIMERDRLGDLFALVELVKEANQ